MKEKIIEKIACIIDLILNPTATDWPIATSDGIDGIPNKKKKPYDYHIFKRNTGHLVTISLNKNKLIYIRWI